MNNIFRWDSPLMQKIALLGNLIALNVLWIVCSLPIVTIGASTSALYYTVFQYQINDENAVFKPFFRGFAKNFKQATIMWILILSLAALMILDIRFLFAYGGDIVMRIAVIAASVALLLIPTQLFPQIARFETKLGPAIKNAALLTMLHFPSCLLMAVLNILPFLIFILFTREFMQWLPLWVGLWFSLVTYLNGRILLKIWNKHISIAEKTDEEQ